MNKRHPESLENCLITFKKSWSEIDHLMELTEKWEMVVGKDLSKECKPLKIEKNILTIVVNHPQWRQALIYNKHRLKERIDKIGIHLNQIKIIQYYELESNNIKSPNAKKVWDNHPSRVSKNNMSICKFCNCPTPNGEIVRWGKCTFCWRKNK